MACEILKSALMAVDGIEGTNQIRRMAIARELLR